MAELTTLKTHSGAITKLSDVEVSSKVTSATDQTYTFHYKVTHAVPLGGYFSILLSADHGNEATGVNGVRISNAETVKRNCFLVANTGKDKGLECNTGETADGRPFVNITCSRAGFGETGTAKGASFKFKIRGLTNPRMRHYVSYFKLYTLDQKFRYID